MTAPATPPGVPTADALLEAMSEAVYVVDLDRIITYWNRFAEELTGYSAATVIGRGCHDGLLNHVDECGNSMCGTRCPLLGTIHDGEPRQTSAFLHHQEGHRVPVAVRSAALRGADGAIRGAVEVFHDDTRNRALTEQLGHAQREALTDPLTGIANRRSLRQTLRLRRDEHSRYGRGYAVLFADVDLFKAVNDQHRHHVGDRVLKLVAATLRDCTRSSDTVGRWGGDEFLLITPTTEAHEAIAFADRARGLVASAWTSDRRHRVAVTLSIGVALAHADEPTRQLVDRADRAMLTAKRDGRNRTVLG